MMARTINSTGQPANSPRPTMAATRRARRTRWSPKGDEPAATSPPGASAAPGRSVVGGTGGAGGVGRSDQRPRPFVGGSGGRRIGARAEGVAHEGAPGGSSAASSSVVTRRASASAATTASASDGRGSVVAIERGGHQGGDVGPPDPAGEEGVDGDLVGGAEPRRCRAAGPTGGVGQAQAAEGVEVGGLEVEPTEGGPVDATERGGDAIGPGQRVADGEAHVGRATAGRWWMHR